MFEKRFSGIKEKLTIMLIFIVAQIISPLYTVNAANTNYVSNRAPLVDTPFVPLPLGTVKADGWLLKMLQFQRDGFTGNAEALYTELGSNSAWLGGNAANSDWERPPYYIKGLVALAYILDDTNLQLKAKKWIDWAINSQQSSGYFGPATNNDWWPRMPMLYAIKDFYEATGDPRVLNFMTKYFQYEANNLSSRPLTEWGKSRAGDNIDTVLWLYNRTGNAFLLTLADTLRNQAYNWTDILTNNTFKNFGGDFQPKHNVNVSEAIKMPAIYYQKSNNSADRNAFINGDTHLSRDHGVITGMSSGTEMLAGRSSVQGVETCAVVERMQSNEEALMILGNPYLGDQLERIAFNALPACFNKSDLHVHQYYHLPNQAQSVSGSHGYEQDYNNALMPSPTSGYPCCRFNMHMGWPYFVKNMWAATNDNGLAVMAYGPSHLTAKVANGVSVTFTENTNYPFEEQIRFTFNASQAVAFPMKLRIPAWCASPSVKVNGIAQSGVSAGAFYTINRTWNNNDTVTVDLPMNVKGTTQINNSIAIERGPLVYSLKIGEQWTAQSTLMPGYNENTVTPTTPWNYGLVLADRNNPGASIAVSKGVWPADNNPFLQSQTPVTLTVNAKKLPGWVLSSPNVNANEVPASPVYSTAATEQITLIPFGAENIRVTYFPVTTTVSSGNIATAAIPLASHCYGGDSVAAMNDGSTAVTPRQTFWNHLGTAEWVEYDWPMTLNINSVKLWWFDDTGSGQCRVPASYTIQYWNGNSWQAVSGASGYGRATNQFNTTTFNPVNTTRLRVNVQLQSGYSGGVVEWEVYQASGPTATPTPVPVSFNDNFNDNAIGSAWSFYSGTWNEQGTILRQDSASQGDPCKAMISNVGNFGSNHTILAKVYVDSWTDGDSARAGVSLFTGTGDGRGYNLLFHNNHSTVQFLDDMTAWGPSYTFNWSNKTWYWFKLKMENGTLSGKVWRDGVAEPSNWPYTWTRSGRSGYPALNGGTSDHGGSCTVFFDDVTVTVP